MSPSPTPPPESRVNGLYEVRRWLILLLLSEAWLFAALAGIARWTALPTSDRAVLVTGLVLIILGWILSRRPVGLWLVTGAPVCLMVATLLNSGDLASGQWIALGVSTGHVAYAIVLLAPRNVGLAAVIGAPILLAVLWSRRPTNVVPGALDVAGGWISVVSLLASAGILWFVWNGLLNQARADDMRLQALSDRVDKEVAAQERSRLWRQTAVTLHERLLSTLRYILQTDAIDQEGLRQLADLSEGHASQTDLADEVRQATAARVAAGIVRVDPAALEMPISDETRTAVRAAIVECALNAVLHGGATDVHVTGRVDNGTACYEISDDGHGIDASSRPGLGWTATLGEGLATVGGTWAISRVKDRTVVTIYVPTTAVDRSAAFIEDGFQQGRALISAPLMAFGLVGIAYVVIAGLSSPQGWPLIGVSVVATLAAVVLVARRCTPGLLSSTAVIAGLAAVPWLMTAAQPPADQAAAITAGVTTAGYALIAVGVWSRWWQWVIGLAAWAIGVLNVASVAAEGGALPIIVALVNCLIIVPVVVVVASIGSRRYQRAQAALAIERDTVQREALRANSAALIDQHLSACVAQADGIIADLARGASLDDDLRHQVLCLEGLIRATIQVDPVDSGEFTRVAARLVNAAFRVSVPARVGTLVSSPDATPLDPDLVRVLEGLIGAYGLVTVRSFNDGRDDHLSLELREPSASGHHDDLKIRETYASGVSVDVSTEPDGSTIVMVSRPVREFVNA